MTDLIVLGVRNPNSYSGTFKGAQQNALYKVPNLVDL